MAKNRLLIKSFWWQWRGVWITTPLISMAILITRYFGLFQPLELFAFDLLVKMRSPQIRDNRVVIVGIGEEDVEKIGTALISDGIYAKLLEKLLKFQPVVIGLDVYRDVPIPLGTDELTKIFENNKNIIGIEKMIGDNRQYRVKASPILKAKKQIGFNDVILDQDNKIRRALLALYRGDNLQVSLGMYLASLYLEKKNINLEITEKDKYWKFKNTVFIPFKSNDGGYSNADSGGYQILLNYRGNVNHFETVSLFDVLDNKLPKNWGKDKIILIGFVGESFQDVHLTPYTNSPDKRMAGVEIHANIVSQIVSSAIDDRASIKTWSKTNENIWIITWTFIGAIITWIFRRKKHFLPEIIVFISSQIILVIIVYIAFLMSWWIPLIPPFMGLISAAGSITIYNARNAGRIRQTFGRYLSAEIVNTLLETPEGVKLGGERRQITILTSDLRGFTAVSESLPPEEVVKILNYYLGFMANIITEYQGTIDEFMGDGILVLFGAPVNRKDDADRAIACSLAMQLAMEEINQQMKLWGYSPLKMGIGINTGEVVVGNIGSEKRAKYGIVGSEVNLTYRIESYTKGREILISEKTLNILKSEVNIAEEKRVSPKGVKEAINIYKIVGIEGKFKLYLPEKEEKIISLKNHFQIRYSLLSEKDVTQVYSEGIIKKIIIKDIEKGAEITLNIDNYLFPNPLDNLKLNLIDFPASEDIYGKVVTVDSSNNSFQLYFTYLSLSTEKIIFSINS
ncbi:MAG: adenylate/guanylate cyclase domain-containing protein [Cyanobacteria bacterium]|nr:adenylate/guanylate cyclase domain-containing protein [Cyanobacteria bacterium CG_2015-16_32_12]NCO76885.1 adenylate/guanylate cyclase domain-containing protein [Cyanobacteria bacterium CG_2015-22_32_23]NCQ03368.1 adenylate/guanylate cyclase domain-containing protein [Cyanobacteria bacterium CG_2015-09_32_10]NCQ40579.1 adenylate/guanylate cyclase domain-containing protein [Cyanobacteria bacterium CG_2015-04_32_10]NCS84385.1 adenylate/guanylate cyclase domain-containing protein [Cyanobacteria